jgi:hypothetical protein
VTLPDAPDAGTGPRLQRRWKLVSPGIFDINYYWLGSSRSMGSGGGQPDRLDGNSVEINVLDRRDGAALGR